MRIRIHSTALIGLFCFMQVIQRRWLGMVAADKAEIRTELNNYLCTSLTSAPPFIRYKANYLLNVLRNGAFRVILLADSLALVSFAEC